MMDAKEAFEAIPFDDDADDPQTWRGLALSAISDMYRYAEDGGPERRYVSADAYAEDAVRLASRSSPEWQSIDSAPKDGTIVLACWADTWPKHPHAEAMYFSEGGWWYAYDGDGHSRPPTHWQPLSAPRAS